MQATLTEFWDNALENRAENMGELQGSRVTQQAALDDLTSLFLCTDEAQGFLEDFHILKGDTGVGLDGLVESFWRWRLRIDDQTTRGELITEIDGLNREIEDLKKQTATAMEVGELVQEAIELHGADSLMRELSGYLDGLGENATEMVKTLEDGHEKESWEDASKHYHEAASIIRIATPLIEGY